MEMELERVSHDKKNEIVGMIEELLNEGYDEVDADILMKIYKKIKSRM